MKMSTRVAGILAALKEEYPDPTCALHYEKDYELMIAVRLSAQCTDERVNKITPALFSAYPTLESFAEAKVEDVEKLVHSCGFYHHKARDIVAACKDLIERFDCKVPDSMEALLTIPGVGRKTANLLLGDLYKKPAVVCDTHCIRICGKLGMTDGTKDPFKAEQQLWKVLPKEESSDFCHRIVLHGRAVCTARNPQCNHCTLSPYCKSYQTSSSK